VSALQPPAPAARRSARARAPSLRRDRTGSHRLLAFLSVSHHPRRRVAFEDNVVAVGEPSQCLATVPVQNLRPLVPVSGRERGQTRILREGSCCHPRGLPSAVDPHWQTSRRASGRPGHLVDGSSQRARGAARPALARSSGVRSRLRLSRSARPLVASGVDVRLGVHAESVNRDNEGLVHALLDDGRVVVGEEILVAAGRGPRAASP